MGFYDELAAMAKDLLKPDAAGGLGQGVVVLSRTTQGVPDANQPWLPVTPTVATETLLAAVSGAEKYADGVTILDTDLKIIAAIPALDWRMATGVVLGLTIDGRAVTILRVRVIPDAGTPAAVEFLARR